MLFLCLTSIFISLFFIIGLIIFVPNYKERAEVISINKLDEYIKQSTKKRKNNNHTMKKPIKNSYLNENFVNLKSENQRTYKPINRFLLSKKLKNYMNKNTELLYIEQHLKKRNLVLINLSEFIEEKINKNTNLYRAIGSTPIIETVATSYAHAVLLKDNFNMFENFKTLTSLVKVYKKEAEILNVLVIAKLIEIYYELIKDILKIKREIERGRVIKHITNNKLSPALLYGIYMFNPSCNKVLYNKKIDIIKSTNDLLSELDEIYYKQRIILNYINFLFKGIR